MANLRDNSDNFQSDVKSMSPTVSREYTVDTQRHRRRKKKADESTELDCEQSGRDRFTATVFITAIDRLLARMDRRYHSYTHVQHTFGFLNNIKSISIQDFCSAVANLQRKYPGDLEEGFVDEIGPSRALIKGQEDTSARSLLHLVKGRSLDTVSKC